MYSPIFRFASIQSNDQHIGQSIGSALASSSTLVIDLTLPTSRTNKNAKENYLDFL